jgi:Na+/proline symporter
MFVVINVFQIFVLDAWGVPFWAGVLIFIILIILYTLKGGIKTIVWTDTLQTTFMLLAVILSIIFISKELHFSFSGLISGVLHSDTSRLMVYDWRAKNFFLKHFLGGAFIAISMTGLDQEMMQKNLSCRNLREAQTNMFTFSGILVFVNLVFLFLGAVLWMYANAHSIAITYTDDLFPTVAFKYLGPIAGIFFLIGLISATYPSADGAITSLTTTFYYDFLGIHKLKSIEGKNKFIRCVTSLSKTVVFFVVIIIFRRTIAFYNDFIDKLKSIESKKKFIRYIIHISVAVIFLIVIVIFRKINDKAIIDKLFTIAGYTYGPLLGFFSFGLFTKWQVKDGWVPLVAIASPVICYMLSVYSKILLNGYAFGYELLIINGMLTFLGLYLLRKKK